MNIVTACLILWSVLATAAAGSTNFTRKESKYQNSIQLWFRTDSHADGAYLVNQIVPAKDLRGMKTALRGVAIGGSCFDEAKIELQTNCREPVLIEFCMSQFVPEDDYVFTYLPCLFETDTFPYRHSASAENCLEEYFPDQAKDWWAKVVECSKDTQTIADIELGLQQLAGFRPPIDQHQPFVMFNENYDSKAAFDLKQFLCQDQKCPDFKPFNRLAMEVYLQVDDIATGKEFFTNRLTTDNLDLVASMLSEQDIDFNVYADNLEDCDKDKCQLLSSVYCAYSTVSIAPKFAFLHCFFTKHQDVVDGDRVETCKADVGLATQDTCDFEDYLARIKQIVPTIRPPNTQLFIVVNDKLNANLLKGEQPIVEQLCQDYFPEDNLVPSCQQCFRRGSATTCQQSQPNVTLFYQTMTAGLDKILETSFPLGELYSPYHTLFDLDLVPYGLITYDEDTKEYTCPGGIDQCHSTWFHACVFSEYKSKSLYSFHAVLEFLRCTAKADKDDEYCFNENFSPSEYSNIIQCAKHDDELKEMIREKAKVMGEPREFALAINDEVVENLTTRNALLLVCGGYEGIKPKLCHSLVLEANGLSNVTLLIGGGESTRTLIVEQLRPLIESESLAILDRSINWNFIAWADAKREGKVITCATELECRIVTLLACSLKQTTTLAKAVNKQARGKQSAQLLVCFFGNEQWNSNPEGAMNECFNQLFSAYFYTETFRCLKDELDRRLPTLLEAEQKTTALVAEQISFPALYIGGQHHQLEETNRGLLRVMCDNYKGSDKPVDCSKSGPSSGGGASGRKNHLLLLLVAVALLQCLAYATAGWW